MTTDLLEKGLISKGEGYGKFVAGPELKEFLRTQINGSEYRAVLIDGLAALGLRTMAQVREH